MNSHYYSKDGVTVATILDCRRALANGNYPVRVRVTYRGLRSYYKTGKDLSKDDWKIINTTRSLLLLAVRKDIENTFEYVKDAVKDLTSKGCFSIDVLEMRLKQSGMTTVNTAIQINEELLRENNQISSADILDALLKNIQKFTKRDVHYEDVTIGWLNRFEEFMRSDGKSQTTIAIYLRALRGIFNKLRSVGIVSEAQYPFGRGKYEIQEGEGRKMALSLEQIGCIAKYEDGLAATAKYRDYWLFLYLCNGINVADFVKLRYIDIQDGEICYVRQKTERRIKTRKVIRVVVVDIMQDIINKWGNEINPNNFIFPILNGAETPVEKKYKTGAITSLINRKMRQIGKSLGFGPISTYTARHSFATVLKRSGASIAFISESLGHTDLKTTENYLASFEKEEREKNAALLTKF